jgi:hypothetical protein
MMGTLNYLTRGQTIVFGFKRHAFVGLLVAFLIGCSGSFSGPSASTVKEAVEWELGTFIRRVQNEDKICDSYSVTNQYSENVDGATHWVFDFKAECTLQYQMGYFTSDRGDVAGYWRTPLQGTKGEHKTVSGSVTIVKRGNSWYFKETRR